MRFDLRTRTADDVVDVDPGRFHEVDVPAHLVERGDLATRAFRASGLESIAIVVDGVAHTWRLDGDGVLETLPGDADARARAEFSGEWFSDIVHDVRSTVALVISEEVGMARGSIVHLTAWEPVLRALIDGRPAYEPGLVDFIDRDGTPLDLHRSFTLGDDPGVLSHFLSTAGFLHLRGVCTPVEMDALSAEIDRWREKMTPDDDRAWYAEVAGEQVCVRVTNLPADPTEFPHAARLGPIADLTDAELRYGGTDLLVKPVGVDKGLSDLPWHKDCALGLHSYRCASLTCGVSVTESDADNGQFGVVAGSHRVNIALFDLDKKVDLPQVYLATEPGDVTVHISCALHCATPPRHAERRVTYSSLRLPGTAGDLDQKIRAVLGDEGVDHSVSTFSRAEYAAALSGPRSQALPPAAPRW